MKRVAIIGAGAGGLCAARHLLSLTCDAVKIQPVVFEQRTRVGGTWLYEEMNEEQNVFSSIYKNLRTNLPKQVMNFPDFPFPDHEPSYLHHTVVLKYLENYTIHYNLTPHIRFQTKVMSVDPLDENQNSKWCRWSVKYQQDGCQEQQEEFDAVIVCNGHYLVPNYPEIPGLKEHYKGKQLHSHYYRDPEDHKGTKNAIVWGFGPSGRDIMLDLSPSCQKIYLCHKGERSKSEFPPNCEELLNLSHVNENGDFVTSSGDVIKDVELLVACTGYHYDFPFFSKKVDLKNENKRVMFNLYKHMFYIDHPTLSFVGIPLTIAPFPVMHQQCGYIARVISGSVNLPTAEEMWEDTVKDRKQRESENEPEKYFHKLANKQFEYNDMLASLSGLPRNPPIIEKLYLYGRMFRSSYIMTYKDMEFVKIDDEHFKVLKTIEDC